MAKGTSKRRTSMKGPVIDTSLEHDPNHHLTGPFLPQTPFGEMSRPSSPLPRVPRAQTVSPWIRWVIDPTLALKVLTVPVVAYLNWELLSPFLKSSLQPILQPYLKLGNFEQLPNPFTPLFFLSNKVETSAPDDPRYAKSWGDLVFMAYHIVFFSFIRQIFTLHVFRPIARRNGIKKEAKLDRFGEQGYAVVYFSVMGLWGWRIMSQLPSYWYRTEYFWIDYPHWDMKPELKRYYLTHMAYWMQQFLVLILKLEKPRKDYKELVAHHIVTLWLVGWSYLVNLTIIGNAVYMSMDLPDAIFAFSKMMNYLQFERAKIVSFTIFVGFWSYFRHWLNLRILWSVWFEYDLAPETARKWVWEDGTYLAGWMRYQVFIPLLLLQFLNLFWYYLILRIAFRAIMAPATLDDDRSDDEDEGDDNEGGKKRK